MCLISQYHPLCPYKCSSVSSNSYARVFISLICAHMQIYMKQNVQNWTSHSLICPNMAAWKPYWL